MLDFSYLPNAPIVEALIDVRIPDNHVFDVHTLEAAKPMLASEYPEFDPQVLNEMKWEQPKGGDEPTITSKSDPFGYHFRSLERGMVVQFRKDGFTFNKLQPYTNWDEIYPLAMSTLRIYDAIVQPPSYSRVGVRYINRLELPFPVKIEDHFTVAPELPDGLQQNFTETQVNVVITDDKIGSIARIIQKIGPIENETNLPAILDIDAVKIGAFTLSEIESIFPILRDFKNKIFNSYLTEQELTRYL